MIKHVITIAQRRVTLNQELVILLNKQTQIKRKIATIDRKLLGLDNIELVSKGRDVTRSHTAPPRR